MAEGEAERSLRLPGALARHGEQARFRRIGVHRMTRRHVGRARHHLALRLFGSILAILGVLVPASLLLGGTAAAASAPTVTAVSPDTGSVFGGTEVTVTGTNFVAGSTSVSFGSTAASGVTVTSSTTLTAVSPPGTAGSVDVVVSVSGVASATGPADLFSYGPPTVTAVSPDTGATAGGTAVTITGTGFTGTAAVAFGKVAASAVTIVSGTTIDATSPAGTAGSVDVTVTTAGPGGGTSPSVPADLFAYGPPTVTAVTPSGGPPTGGTVITVTGTGFVPGATVDVGTQPATEVTVHSGTSLTAATPAGTAGPADVTVTTPAGTSATSSADQFVYGAPSVGWVSPDAGPLAGGTPVTIAGSAFTAGATVDFGANPATSVVVVSPSLITAVAPAGTAAGSVDVTVSDSAGASPPGVHALYAYGPPAVTAVTPDAGPSAGNNAVTVTVTGTGFAPGATVEFGGVPSSVVTVTSATTLTAVAPPVGQETVDVTVTTPEGTSSTNPGDLFAFARPTVTGISPAVGPAAGGTVVSVSGTGFVPGVTVSFGTTAATAVVVESSTLLVATSPAGAGTVGVTVTNADGTSATSSADQFTYGTLEVTAVSPDGGPTTGGTTVTITGTGFASGATVAFGTTPATGVVVNSASSISAVTPALAAGVVDVTVTAGTATSPLSEADQYAYGAPTVTAVNPSAGPVAGGGRMIVTGSGFVPGSTVDFGATASPSVVVLSSTTLSAAIPAGAGGTVDVTVTTPGGVSATSTADRYLYVAPPTVTGVSPDGGPAAGGTSVTITGTGFAPGAKVSFGVTAATSATVTSSTSITAVAPAGFAGSVDVTVTTGGGASSPNPGDLFAYGAPTVSLVSPDAGATTGGTTVAVTGTGFVPGATVGVGSAAATGVTVLSGTELTAVVPAGTAGSVDVTVTTPGGTSTPAVGDLYAYGPPSVTGVLPESGAAAGGNSVTVYGTGFVADSSVQFGTAPATRVTVVSGTVLTAVAPAGEGPVDVTVTTPAGTSATSTADKYIFGPPTVTSVSPDTGPTSGGTTVTISGSNFTADATVQFGGQAATSVTVTSPTSLTAVAPALSGSVDVTVTTAAGTSATTVDDLFAAGAPTVTGISPDAGPTSGGTPVTITGTGFVPDATVSFGPLLAAGWTVDSGTQITAVSPPNSGPVGVTVTTGQGSAASSSANVFIYGAPTVSAVSPGTGPTSGGTSVTITGTDFTSTATVDFGSVAATSVTVNSSTSITATSPAESAGVVDVTVTTAVSTSATTPADEFAYSDQLVVSCAAPPYAQPDQSCAGINLPAATLDGMGQITQAPANTTYITDDRGTSAGWSLSAYLLPTAGNPNPGCAGYAGFCNASVTSSSANAQIPASDFSVSNISCTTAPGNTNPEPTAGTASQFPNGEGAVSLCTAASGASSGTFDLNATYSLAIPSSVYAGTYQATVEYLAF